MNRDSASLVGVIPTIDEITDDISPGHALDTDMHDEGDDLACRIIQIAAVKHLRQEAVEEGITGTAVGIVKEALDELVGVLWDELRLEEMDALLAIVDAVEARTANKPAS